MSNVVTLRSSNAEEALKRFLEYAQSGKVKEIAIFAPNADDSNDLFYHVSSGMKLSDILISKHQLEWIALKLNDDDR